MSSTNTLSDKKYTSKPFFNFTLTQNWQHFALYFIIVILAMIVPCLMSINSSGVLVGENVSEWYVKDLFNALGCVGFVISVVIGLFAGMSAISYVNSKKQVGCYHSFPVRREWMYISETSVKAIYYFISIIIGFSITFTMIALTMPRAWTYLDTYLHFAFFSILCFMWVFSLVLFSAGLTGTSFMRLVMSGVIVFLPFALYVLIVYSVSYGFSNMYESFYFDFDRLKFYFPFLRIINDFTTIAEGEHVFGTELLMLPEIALFYVGGLFLHKYRRSESSGTTIIWKPVFMVVRCILIFTAGLLGMMLFGSGIFGGSSLINFIFGAAVGLILSFMLVNSVLYRSSKSMFKGARSFVLIVLLTIVFIFFVPLNITGMIGTPYSPSNTGKIEIDIGSIDITIEDPNEVKTIAALINDEYYSLEKKQDTESGVVHYTVEYKDYGTFIKYSSDERIFEYFNDYMLPESDEYFEYLEAGGRVGWYSDTTSINIVQHAKFGIPLAFRMNVETNSGLVNAIRETDQYIEYMNVGSWIDFDSIESIEFNIGYDSLNLYLTPEESVVYTETLKNGYWDSNKTLLDVELDIGDIIKKFNYDPQDKYNYSIIGTVWVQYRDENYRYRSVNLPIYANNIELYNAVVNVWEMVDPNCGYYKVKSPEEIIPKMYTNVEAAIIIDCTTAEARWIDVDQLYVFADKLSFVGARSMDGVSHHSAMSDSKYMLLLCEQYGLEGRRYSEIRFRDRAISESELEKLFMSLK